MIDLPPALPLLAAITEADYPALAFWALGSLSALVVAIDRATAIWFRVKEKPPAHEVYATRADHSALSAKVEAMAARPFATRDELSEVHQRIDDLMGSMTKAVKSAADEMSKDVEAVKREVHEVMQSLQAIHRSIGQLEGSLTKRRAS